MEINIIKFEDLDEIQLFNPISGEEVCILPKIGGVVRKIALSKKDKKFTILNCGDTKSEVMEKGSASNLLFPWPNRVREGKYSFEGTEYQLTINEINRNNAIHGLIFDRPFDVVEKTIENNCAKVTLAYNYLGEKNGFPFPFIFSVEYVLHESEGFSMNIKVENNGAKSFPFGFGWHPYFSFENETLTDWDVMLPVNKMYLSDNQMIPVGHGVYKYPNIWNSLANKSYDTVFLIDSNSNVCNTKLRSNVSNVTINIWQQCQANDYNYLVIYTPISNNRIAIEPMTCNTDAFNSKEGLQILKAGDVYRLSCGVNLE
jgi:aldose 1-epimerase